MTWYTVSNCPQMCALKKTLVFETVKFTIIVACGGMQHFDYLKRE